MSATTAWKTEPESTLDEMATGERLGKHAIRGGGEDDFPIVEPNTPKYCRYDRTSPFEYPPGQISAFLNARSDPEPNLTTAYNRPRKSYLPSPLRALRMFDHFRVSGKLPSFFVKRPIVLFRNHETIGIAFLLKRTENEP